MCKINLTVHVRDEWRPSESTEVAQFDRAGVAAVPAIGSRIDLSPLMGYSDEFLVAEITSVVYPVAPKGDDVREPLVVALLSFDDGSQLLADQA